MEPNGVQLAMRCLGASRLGWTSRGPQVFRQLPSRCAIARAGCRLRSQSWGIVPSVNHTMSRMTTPATSSMADFPSSSESVSETSAAAKTWEIRLLYDGDCPLCMMEVNMLKEKDAGSGKIDFVDISSPSYSPEANAGVSYVQAMQQIHGILPDGTVIKNVEVFRRCYEAVGLGWIYAVTKFEPIGKLADAVYGVWAKYRLPITGRQPLEIVLEKRKNNMEGVTCDSVDSCELPFAPKE